MVIESRYIRSVVEATLSSAAATLGVRSSYFLLAAAALRIFSRIDCHNRDSSALSSFIRLGRARFLAAILLSRGFSAVDVVLLSEDVPYLAGGCD